MSEDASPTDETEQPPEGIFEIKHRPEREPVVSGDVSYCPDCGEEVPPSNTEFQQDLVLNRYRTAFNCPSCGYHGEVFRHD